MGDVIQWVAMALLTLAITKNGFAIAKLARSIAANAQAIKSAADMLGGLMNMAQKIGDDDDANRDQ